MTRFEEELHAMFDHIWNCEISHPVFQDTVGDLMTAVVQCYNNLQCEEKVKTTAEDDLISMKNAIGCLSNGTCKEEMRWCDDGDCPPVARIRKVPPARPRTGRWVKVSGYATAGGDPVYKCGTCGGSLHVHGVEHPNRILYCRECGTVNAYPWEKVEEEA